MLAFEIQHWERGCCRVAGVDEAGRGPLAGPVVAAAVVFPPDLLRREAGLSLAGLTDSKLLTPANRYRFFSLLNALPGIDIGIGQAPVAEIDHHNILRATHMAMRRAVEALVTVPDHLLVDGLPVPGLPVSATAVVKGDRKSLSIAAASVIAKVTRDRLLEALDAAYPDYGFARHKGYGTALHMQRLLEFGPCPQHRMSFQPVRDAAGIRARKVAGRPA